MAFGEKLKFLREDKGLKQEDLARIMRVDRSTVGKWESDSSKPDFDKVLKLAEYFSVTTDFLLNNLKADALSNLVDCIRLDRDYGQFAKDIGVSENYMFDLCLGTIKAPPPKEILKKLSEDSDNILSIDYLELLEAAGYIDKKTTLQMRKKEVKEIEKFHTARKAENPDYIFPIDPSDLTKIPILGVIRAGQPIYAEENILGYTHIEKEKVNGNNIFALRVTGDSMNMLGIQENDIVIVREQPEVYNGEIGVVLVNGEDATIKKVYQTDGNITLMPQSTNPQHQPQIYDPKKIDVRILGKVIESRRKF